MYHQPVLLQESLEGLNIRSGGVFVDLTFGGGGHSAEILNRLGKGKLYAFDVDRESENNAIKDKRFIFIRGNFRYIKNFLHFHKVDKIDGALGDLGVSSHHFDEADRGFSFRFNSQLDMRMNQEAELSAMDILNTYDRKALYTLFSENGELKNSGKVCDRIIRLREHQRIRMVDELVTGIEDCIPQKFRNKYLAQLFQAIRIEVNDELGALKEMIESVTDMLNAGGRFCLITYHSLEDRLVKNYFRAGNFRGEISTDIYGNRRIPYKQISRGVITPQKAELEQNSRARSAKLRIAERSTN